MKSIIKDHNQEQITRTMADLFSNGEAIARETKFVQRQSPMTGLLFLQTLVFGFLKNAQASLNQLVRQSAKLGVPISLQGLDQRFNAYSVAFVKAIYLQALERFKSQQALPIEILQQFTRLFVIDSTFKVLPDSLASEFPGSGGKASQASLKVQLVFEFIYGNLAQLTVEAGRAADQAFTQYLDLVQAGALVLMDLGCFRLASLRAIAAKGAYFIIRYHYPTALFDPKGPRIDLLELLQDNPQELWEELVLMGASAAQGLPCRLIVTPVPLAVAAERRRKAKRKAHEHGKILTDRYLNVLGWSIFLTNVPCAMLSSTQVILFYRIRWQIELIFKLWKSYCGLAYIPATRQERVLTEFYAKLLVAVLTSFLIAPLRMLDKARSDREISSVQVRQILADFAQDLASKIMDVHALKAILDEIYQYVARFGFKQIRHKKPNVGPLLAQLSIPSPP